MKVGTDGVLLGAWADIGGCRSILDVGTGSGLIALMMAQRNGLASITAIEIDSDAAMQARENVICSPFRGRIEVLPLSLQEFQSTVTGKFDAIVSNPPFFVNSLPSPDLRRTGARHAGSLTADELFSISRKLLSESGTLSLIYPFQDRELVMAAASRGGFGLSRETVVYPTPTLPPKRVLMEFTAGPGRVCRKRFGYRGGTSPVFACICHSGKGFLPLFVNNFFYLCSTISQQLTTGR